MPGVTLNLKKRIESTIRSISCWCSKTAVGISKRGLKVGGLGGFFSGGVLSTLNLKKRIERLYTVHTWTKKHKPRISKRGLKVPQ